MKKIVLASDGSGFDLKESIKDHLVSNNYEVKDLTPEPDDYYSAGYNAGSSIVNGESDYAIIFCGNGYGIAMGAQKHDGLSVINCAISSQAKSGRAVNDAKVLAMGGNIVTSTVAKDIVDTFLTTNFGDGLSEEDQDYMRNSFDELNKLKENE